MSCLLELRLFFFLTDPRIDAFDCKRRCDNDYPCVSNNLNSADMCSCHDWENLVKIRMSDEAPDKEDEYGSNDEEG